MGKVRRGNYIFIWYIGDHTPPHVHVYRDGRLIVKWDLLNEAALFGQSNANIVKLVNELKNEGRFDEILKN